MIKRFKRNLALAAVGSLCLLPVASQAAPPSKSEIEQLKQQVQQLMEQNQQLNQRLGEMEKSMQAQPAAEEPTARHKSVIEQEVARQLDEKKVGPSLNEFVKLSGSIEGDYKLGKDFQGDHFSEFVLDTVDLIFDIKVVDWATGTIVVEYDGTDGGDDFNIDEAHITLGKTEDFPFFLTAGKVYAPFGDFTTNMIQDPLTLTLGEINSAGVIAGFEKNGFTAAVFSYNGMGENSDPLDDDNDTINGFGASLAYSYGQEDRGFKVGAAWVNNIADANATTDILEDNGVYSISDQVAGMALFFGGNYKGFSLQTEYVTALDSFAVNEIPYGLDEETWVNGAEPAAWNSELAYTTAILDKETIFAIGYQKSWEAVALELPEHRYIAAISVGIFDGTSLAFEYSHDKDYAAGDGGTGNSGHGFTTRLAYEF